MSGPHPRAAGRRARPGTLALRGAGLRRKQFAPCLPCPSIRRRRRRLALAGDVGPVAWNRCGSAPAHSAARSSLSGTIASAGHSGSQTPQSMHSSGMDHQHVLADIEAVDRTYLDTIHVFAANAALGDHVGHRWLLVTGAKVRRSRRAICRLFRLAARVACTAAERRRRRRRAGFRDTAAAPPAAGPRRAASASTSITRTSSRSGSVITSPTRSRACGLSVGWRLMRSRPSATSRAQSARARMKRAHHSHLSSRCQSRSSTGVAGLTGGRDERGQRRERAFAVRRRNRRPRSATPVRRRRRCGAISGGPAGRTRLRPTCRPATAGTRARAAPPAALPSAPRAGRRGRTGIGHRPEPAAPGKFGGDMLGDVEAQQHRPRRDPAHRGREPVRPVGRRLGERDHAGRRQRRHRRRRGPAPTAPPGAPRRAA